MRYLSDTRQLYGDDLANATDARDSLARMLYGDNQLTLDWNNALKTADSLMLNYNSSRVAATNGVKPNALNTATNIANSVAPSNSSSSGTTSNAGNVAPNLSDAMRNYQSNTNSNVSTLFDIMHGRI